MKACIIQPPYSHDLAHSDEYFEYKLKKLDGVTFENNDNFDISLVLNIVFKLFNLFILALWLNITNNAISKLTIIASNLTFPINLDKSLRRYLHRCVLLKFDTVIIRLFFLTFFIFFVQK